MRLIDPLIDRSIDWLIDFYFELVLISNLFQCPSWFLGSKFDLEPDNVDTEEKNEHYETEL